jgi:WD40 repeat protein
VTAASSTFCRTPSSATRISPEVIDHISPDGRRLLADDNAGLWAVRPHRHGSRRLLFPIKEDGAVITAAWSPDGRWIAVVGFVDTNDPHYLRLISRDGRVQRPIELPDTITWLGSLSWRPQRSG